VVGNSVFLVLALAIGWQFSVAGHAQSHSSWKVTLEPARPVNGSPVLLRVTSPVQLVSLQGTWMDHKIAFRYTEHCHCWYAMAGVALSTKPGKYPVQLQGDSATEHGLAFTHEVLIHAGHYPSTTISVAPEYVEPPKELEARIEQEQAVKKKAFADTSVVPVWTGKFAPPSDTAVSGPFGSARVFNGKTKNQHTGLDFHAAIGTPIHATNRGKVILARSLYFEGNCVMVDHGDGLETLYLHLSEFKVKEGDMVGKGQLLGLSGGTGRATGPHLHFAVRWQGTYLDPATLLKLTTP